MAALWLTALLLGMSNSLRADEPLAPTIILRLKRGPFGTYHFAPTGTTRAVVLFGEGTFGVANFTLQMANLRVVQFAAAGDWMNNTDWIRGLQTPHRLFELENSNHDFNGADETFADDLLDGINWILDPAKSAGDETTSDLH